jgi:hypothetical protein
MYQPTSTVLFPVMYDKHTCNVSSRAPANVDDATEMFTDNITVTNANLTLNSVEISISLIFYFVIKIQFSVTNEPKGWNSERQVSFNCCILNLLIAGFQGYCATN